MLIGAQGEIRRQLQQQHPRSFDAQLLQPLKPVQTAAELHLCAEQHKGRGIPLPQRCSSFGTAREKGVKLLMAGVEVRCRNHTVHPRLPRKLKLAEGGL